MGLGWTAGKSHPGWGKGTGSILHPVSPRTHISFASSFQGPFYKRIFCTRSVIFSLLGLSHFVLGSNME